MRLEKSNLAFVPNNHPLHCNTLPVCAVEFLEINNHEFVVRNTADADAERDRRHDLNFNQDCLLPAAKAKGGPVQ